MTHYILDADRNPVLCDDTMLWGVWFQNEHNRRVAFDEVAPGVTVSTVFLGIDHRFLDSGPPILFETMVFDDYDDGDQFRCCTWQEAVDQHGAVVDAVREKLTAKSRCT